MIEVLNEKGTPYASPYSLLFDIRTNDMGCDPILRDIHNKASTELKNSALSQQNVIGNVHYTIYPHFFCDR